MTDTTQTTDTPQPTMEALQAEVERLRTHSAQLLADLKTERREHHKTKDELQIALGGESATWKQRYHQEAVLAPLERELAGAAAVPVKYLQDICTDLGLLKMEEDAEGLARPVWRDQNDEPANMDRGLHGFLSEVYRVTENSQLGAALRAIGATGSGAVASHGGYQLPKVEKDGAFQAQQAQYGLR